MQYHIWEEFEDTKGVIRIRKSKKNRQHNGQKKKNKRTNNDLQIITHKIKDQVTRMPLNMSYFISYASVLRVSRIRSILLSIFVSLNSVLLPVSLYVIIVTVNFTSYYRHITVILLSAGFINVNPDYASCVLLVLNETLIIH